MIIQELKQQIKKLGAKYHHTWDGIRFYYKESDKFNCLGFNLNGTKFVVVSGSEEQRKIHGVCYLLYMFLEILPCVIYYPERNEALLINPEDGKEITFNGSLLYRCALKVRGEKDKAKEALQVS